MCSVESVELWRVDFWGGGRQVSGLALWIRWVLYELRVVYLGRRSFSTSLHCVLKGEFPERPGQAR